MRSIYVSVPLQETSHVLPYVYFCLFEINSRHFSIELLNLGILRVVSIVSQCFNQRNQVRFGCSLQNVESFRQLKFVAANSLLDKRFPVTVVYLLHIELFLNFRTATLYIVTICHHLELNHLHIRLDFILYLLIV